MAQQNFSKLVKNILSFNLSSPYNVDALRKRPKETPLEWIRAEELIKKITES